MSSVKNRLDAHAARLAELEKRVEALEAGAPQAESRTESREIPQVDPDS